MDTTGRDVRVGQEPQPAAPERGRLLPGSPGLASGAPMPVRPTASPRS